MAENQKEKLMRVLNCSPEEAEDVMKWDKVIDQGGRTPYDLDPAAEKEAKKFANSKEKKKPVVYEFKQRERKANPTKGGIIAAVAEFLEKNCDLLIENVQITNKERQIAFTVGELSYDLTLVQHRKK